MGEGKEVERGVARERRNCFYSFMHCLIYSFGRNQMFSLLLQAICLLLKEISVNSRWNRLGSAEQEENWAVGRTVARREERERGIAMEG